MKTKNFSYIVVLLFIASFGVSAQNTDSKAVYISGTKFTYPLIEKWIAEYAKVNPNANIKLVQKKTDVKSPDLTIIAHIPVKEDLQGNQEIVYVGRYGLLPVTNAANPLIAKVSRKGLRKKELEKLFFEESIFEEDEESGSKPKFKANVYTRESQACASAVLSRYYGYSAADLKGKKVTGDDIYLLSAVKRDTFGLAFNNLGYIFDTNTRKIKDGISIVPLDLKKEVREALASNVDNAIDLLEKNSFESIPVEKIGFLYSQATVKREANDFLKWVLSNGQKFNHELGFLNLDELTLAEQSKKVTDQLYTQR